MQLLPIDDIAKICHEANKVYCENLGDNSQDHWEDAPDWQKKSSIEGVKFVINLLKVGREVTGKVIFDNWKRHKYADGWVFGPVKDIEKKTHPCLVDWEDLPIEQRRKDTIFANIVSALA